MRGTLLPVILLVCGLAGCGSVWNNPYPAEDRGKNIYYTFFVERPRHFDPAQSYTSDEYDVIQQIYEPPFQYHYLKRPYQLIPATATEVPHPKYYDAGATCPPAPTQRGSPTASTTSASARGSCTSRTRRSR
jgi:oligopeptide transport system substrate-binding protein